MAWAIGCWIVRTSSSRPGRSSTGGEGYVRMAMVPTLEECERAVGSLDRLFAEVRVSEELAAPYRRDLTRSGDPDRADRQRGRRGRHRGA
jgi:hypothetical protein